MIYEKNVKGNKHTYTLTFLKNVTFNDPFVLNSLNVPNSYIFKCKRASKVENGGENLVFFYELGPFLVFIPCLTQKIVEFWPITLNLSAFLSIKSNGHYIFHLLEELKVMGC